MCSFVERSVFGCCTTRSCQVTRSIREMLEKRKSSLAKKVPVIAYYQPDFKRGEIDTHTSMLLL